LGGVGFAAVEQVRETEQEEARGEVAGGQVDG